MDYIAKREAWDEVHREELLEEWALTIRHWRLMGVTEQEMETLLRARLVHPDSRQDIIEEVLGSDG